MMRWYNGTHMENNMQEKMSVDDALISLAAENTK